MASIVRRALAPLGAITAIVGEEVTAYVLTAETVSGRVLTVFPTRQNPAVTADMAADGAHRLRCGGCELCR